MNTDRYPYLTVAFCTRNRPEALTRAIRSVLAQVREIGIGVEVRIYDDGCVNQTDIDLWVRESEAVGATFFYARKFPWQAGLYRSRRFAVHDALGDILLYLDDDAEILDGYLKRLIENFAEDHGLSGCGGVDQESLPETNGFFGEAFASLFCLRGRGPGQLSSTGMNFSQSLWRRQHAKFNSEFLHGCNMAFRRSALVGMVDLNIDWLSGHAPCEDLVLSNIASRSGSLIVDPDLRMLHHCEPGGRGNNGERLAARLRNCARFYKFQKGNKPGTLFFWSAFGMFLKDLIKSILGGGSAEGLRISDVLLAYRLRSWRH